MRSIVKIIILVLVIFGLSLFATKMSIDHTFKKVECNQVVETTSVQHSPATIEV